MVLVCSGLWRRRAEKLLGTYDRVVLLRYSLVLAFLLLSVLSSFASQMTPSKKASVESDEELAELIESIKTFLFQNLDSAQVYLSILKEESSADSDSWGEYLKLELSYHYYRGDLDSALYYTQLYHDFGRETEDPNIVAYGLSKLMLFHSFNGDLEQSDLAYNELLEFVPQISDRDQLAKMYSALGARETNDERYASAINYYLDIDSIYAIDDISNRSRAMALENIGGLYGNLKDTLAVEYFRRSKEMYAAIDDIEGVNSISLSLGKHFIRLGKYEEALFELLECKEFFEEYQNQEYLVSLYEGLLVCYVNEGQLKEAEKYQSKLETLFDQDDQSRFLYSFNINSGELYYHKKEYDKAIGYYLDALSSHTVERVMIYEGLKGITKTYEAKRDYKSAYHYAKQQSAFRDSLNELRNYQAFQNLETQYKTKQKEEEIELLNVQNNLVEQKQRLYSTIYISIISIIALLSSFLYFLYRNRRKMALQLDALDKMKSKFFTNISHEFRTPLTIIGGLANQVLKSSDLDSRHISSLQTIRGNVDRLSELTNQLIDLNKIDAKKIEASYVSGDIHAYLRTYASLFSSYISSQQKELILSIPSEPLIMDFDENKIQSVLYNLLQNAIKHTGENGRIEIRASREENKFCLEFIDNGEGVSESIIHQIFDRFYSTSEQGALGSGVGLAYVKELIRLCQGDIFVKSKLGEGSIFTVTLPIVNQATTKASLDIELPIKLSVQSEVDKSKSERLDISAEMQMLIVEDNEDILEYLKMLLQDDFLITTAKNGKEAIKVLESEPVDFILSDVMMPEMDGFEFCKFVKNHIDYSHIPFVLLTAKTLSADKRRGHELGVDGYLTKPFDEDELLALITSLLKKRRDKIDWFTEVLELKSAHQERELIRQEDLDFIKRLQSLILSNSIAFGVEEMSLEMNMTSKSLRKKVKTLTGKALNRYSSHIRLEKSKELLLCTSYTVSQIASQVGYHDTAYYSRVFKKYNNMSPKYFRTQERQLKEE